MTEEWGDDAELRNGGDAERGADPDTVRDAFVDAAPRTAAEVALAVDAPEDAVADALAALEERGDLRRTAVPAADSAEGGDVAADADGTEGSDAAVSLWHLPAETLRERVPEGIAEADDDIDRALAEMAVPGASRMMRDWRRDAVRAVVEHLREDGPATGTEIRAAVYPPHSAGYDDSDAWWDCVRPRLLSVPGVDREDGAWHDEES